MTTKGLLTTWTAVQDFIFAGNATFTLKSLKTGVRFTYKVIVKKQDAEKVAKLRLESVGRANVAEADVVYFLNLLRGPDNTADFTYMGVLRQKPVRYFWTAASGKVGRQRIGRWSGWSMH